MGIDMDISTGMAMDTVMEPNNQPASAKIVPTKIKGEKK